MKTLGLAREVLRPSKTPAVPVYLIHFVTGRCNARCPHCFIFNPNDPRFEGEELRLEEIERLARSLNGGVYNVSLTGGEPFLRKDIVDIASLYFEFGGAQVVSLFTNGFFPDRAVEAVERLTSRWPDRNLVVTTSIDDLFGAHDDYRKLRGGFEKALSTYARISAMGLPNVDLSVNVTVSHQNQDRLDELYDHLVRERGVRTLACTIVRGDPLDPESADVDLAKYERFAQRIDTGLRTGELDCFGGFSGASLVNAKSAVMRRLISATVRDGYQVPCYAGRLLGVVYANGDVYPCEILERPVANLRDYDMSLAKAWDSAEAHRTREWIWDTKCHCTFECAMTVNVLFNPRLSPTVMKETAVQFLGRRVARRP